MTALSLRGASYRYAAGTVVGPVDLAVRSGELVLLTGPTGCGKSTVLRLAAGLLGRHGQGTVAGEVRIAGLDPASTRPSERVGLCGFVSQEPDDQIATGTLGDEVAFGPESAGWPADRIEARVTESLARMGLPVEPDRSPLALSGGQRQRLAIAAALAVRPPVLLLDEPLAHLDPRGARDLLVQLSRLCREDGVGVLLVEHRIAAVWDVCDRVVVMGEEGRIAADAPPAAIDPGLLRRLGLAVPGSVEEEDALGPVEPARPLGPRVALATALRWEWEGVPALDGVSLEVRAGERVAVLGPNGAGKSTLLAALGCRLSLRSPARVESVRPVDVPQDPDLALFCRTVRSEIAYGPSEQRLGRPEVERLVALASVALSVGDLLDRPPQALSRGQRVRVAVAAALACQPGLLLLDEPTAGQDRAQLDRMMLALAASLDGSAVVFATHDEALARRHATRIVRMEAGRVVADGPPRPELP